MLVRDIANNFFDDIFKGDDSRHTTVFINDDGHLETFFAQLNKQCAQVKGLRHARGLGKQGRGNDGNFIAFLERNSDRSTQRNETDDVIPVFSDHRETRMPGFMGRTDNIGSHCIFRNRMEKATVRHHVRRIQFADSDRVREQRCRRGIQSSLLSRVTNHRGKLRGGARRRKLFLRLNTHQVQYAVG